MGPEQDDLLQKCSHVFKQKFISSGSAFQKLKRFVSVPPVELLPSLASGAVVVQHCCSVFSISVQFQNTY